MGHLCDIVALESKEYFVHPHHDVEVVLPIPANLVQRWAVCDEDTLLTLMGITH